MFTICPKCALTLDVTAGDLRVGQGYVRCGRCSSVFNSLASLRDEPNTDRESTERTDYADMSDSALEFDPSRSDVSQLFVGPFGETEETGSGTFETVVLESETGSESSLDGEAFADEDLRDLVSRLDRDLTGLDPEPNKFADPPSRPPPARSSPAAEPPAPAPVPAPAAAVRKVASPLKPPPRTVPDTPATPGAAPAPQRGASPNPVPIAPKSAPSPMPTAAPSALAPSQPPRPPVPTAPTARVIAPARPVSIAVPPPPAAAARVMPPAAPPPGAALDRGPPPKPIAVPTNRALPPKAPLSERAAPTSRLPTTPPPAPAPAGLPTAATAPTNAPPAARGVMPIEEDSEHFAIAPALAAAVAAVHRKPAPSPKEATVVTPLTEAPEELASPANFVQQLTDPESLAPRHDQNRALLALSGALVLALAAQLVNYYRGDLVARGWFAGSLTHLYAALGAPITPNWDVDAYEIRQLGAAASAAANGTLLIRASVKNGAPRAQPAPVIQLTLQDRYGNRLASRALEPDEYLATGSERTFLAAGERIDTEIAVADPGQSAVGFEIDTCLHTANGALRCAAERRPP